MSELARTHDRQIDCRHNAGVSCDCGCHRPGWLDYRLQEILEQYRKRVYYGSGFGIEAEVAVERIKALLRY